MPGKDEQGYFGSSAVKTAKARDVVALSAFENVYGRSFGKDIAGRGSGISEPALDVGLEDGEEPGFGIIRPDGGVLAFRGDDVGDFVLELEPFAIWKVVAH